MYVSDLLNSQLLIFRLNDFLSAKLEEMIDMNLDVANKWNVSKLESLI
jgi:hypothetical protein